MKGAHIEKEGLDGIPLSRHLREAIAECDALRKDTDYYLDSSYWHEAPGARDGVPMGPCAVCLAGALMAETLEPEEVSTPSSREWRDDQKNLFQCLEAIRNGHMGNAVWLWTLSSERRAQIEDLCAEECGNDGYGNGYLKCLSWGPDEGDWEAARRRLIGRAEMLEKINL